LRCLKNIFFALKRIFINPKNVKLKSSFPHLFNNHFIFLGALRPPLAVAGVFRGSLRSVLRTQALRPGTPSA
jgi:hypothetical protein